VWSIRANQSQGARAVGGRLALTTHRLVFEPHAFDAATGGRTWAVPLAAIAEAGEEPRTWHPFDGGMRRRLRVTPRDGQKALFVVPRLADAVAAVRAALGQVACA
jgi:hypothetical protein